MALTIAEYLRTVNPNVGLVLNLDGVSYRIGVEDVNSDEILATLGGVIDVVRRTGGLSNSGVLSGDAQVKGSAGVVYWISLSDTAALAIELNDSVGGAGTDLWGIDIPADGYGHFIFDPPLEFSTAIYLDVSTVTCKVTIGYI